MFEDVKFLDIRKIAKFRGELKIPLKFKEDAYKNVFKPACDVDIRIKSLDSIFDVTCEASFVLAHRNPNQALQICKFLFRYIISLGFRKREAGTEGSKSFKKSRQFNAFKKCKKNLEQFIKILDEVGDPLLPTAQMIHSTKVYLFKIENQFNEIIDRQASQSNYQNYLKDLGDVLGFDVAEQTLLLVYDNLMRSKIQIDEKGSPLEFSVGGIRWTPVTRKTLEEQFRNFREENGLGLRKRGRPKKA